MTAAIIALSAVAAGLTAALIALVIRHLRLEGDWASASNRAWKSDADALTARAELADALQRESIARDNSALYKAKLTTEQLAMLREQRKTRDDLKSVQAIGTDQQRVDAGIRVLRGIAAATRRHDYVDEDRTDPLRKPATTTDSTKP
jgi:hypothetical protein